MFFIFFFRWIFIGTVVEIGFSQITSYTFLDGENTTVLRFYQMLLTKVKSLCFNQVLQTLVLGN